MTVKDYFFCGVGGSGMLPLAAIVRARGAHVEGSDRALDQGRTNAKFDYLRALGVELHPQDGSGVTRPEQIIVASAAVEDTVPDIVAAKALGAARMSRAELLSEIFNASQTPIGVAGTSGKSTTTAMIGWILHAAGKAPTVMNGAVMKNFVSETAPFASAVVGDGPAFVSEVDESDGSIAMYAPDIAVLNNIALDHKSMDELRALFGGFVERARIAVLNLDNDETAEIASRLSDKTITYSIEDPSADYFAQNIQPEQFGVSFEILGARAPVKLQMPGRHNVSNALAAVAAASACGVALDDAVAALCCFKGVQRRLEYVGEAGGVTVIDDFAHNPDKIAASLRTLHEFPGRLLVMFQPHGYGPLKNMSAEFAACFRAGLGEDDVLLMPEPVYFGGTVDRSVSSKDVADEIISLGRHAIAPGDRSDCAAQLLAMAKPGDRIIIMGARDDTLSVFARELLAAIDQRAA